MADTGITAVKFFRASVIAAATECGSRVYLNQAPQSAAFPYVVLSVVSREESPTQDSGSAVDTFRIQCDCYAKPSTTLSGFERVSIIAGLIRSQVSRSYDTGTYSHIVDSVQEVNYLTDYIEDIDLYRVTNDYLVRIIPTAGMVSTISSGTYTPTVASLSNVDTVEAQQAQYMRVGSTVTVSGTVNVNLTDEATAGVFTLTLPIASATDNEEDIAGVATCVISSGSYTGMIDAETTGNKARFRVVGADSIAITYSYTFTYQII